MRFIASCDDSSMRTIRPKPRQATRYPTRIGSRTCPYFEIHSPVGRETQETVNEKGSMLTPLMRAEVPLTAWKKMGR